MATVGAMGNLERDAALTEVGDGVWELVLSRDWEIWGPNGGYVAAVAMSAARSVSGRARPANVSVHFLGVANFDDPVRVSARVLRSARTATSVAVHAEQGGRPIVEAMVWAVDGDLDGLAHDEAPMPDVPHWSQCATIQERLAASATPVSPYRFWDNFDSRPPSWVDDWESREPGPPLYQNWMRFNDEPVATDPWARAARLLLLVDLGGWPAIGRRHLDPSWMAPSIDVSCEFHRLDTDLATDDGWYLLQGESPHASGGLIGTHQQVWSADGRLLASGVSHLLCRRIDVT